MGSFLQLVSKPAVIINAVNIAANSIDFFNISSSLPVFVFHHVEGFAASLSEANTTSDYISCGSLRVFFSRTPPQSPSLARLGRWYPFAMHFY